MWRYSCRQVLVYHWCCHQSPGPVCGTPHSGGLSHSAELGGARWAERWSVGRCVCQAAGLTVALVVQQGEPPACVQVTSHWRSSPVLCTPPSSLHTYIHKDIFERSNQWLYNKHNYCRYSTTTKQIKQLRVYLNGPNFEAVEKKGLKEMMWRSEWGTKWERRWWRWVEWIEGHLRGGGDLWMIRSRSLFPNLIQFTFQ